LVEIYKPFIIEYGGFVLVDTGHSRGCTINVVKTTIRLGVEPEAIDLCIMTHRYRDYVGGPRAFKETCNFEVVSHRAEAEAIEKATGVSVNNKLKALDFNAIYQSHGEDIPEGGKEKLSELLRSLKNV